MVPNALVPDTVNVEAATTESVEIPVVVIVENVAVGAFKVVMVADVKLVVPVT